MSPGQLASYLRMASWVVIKDISNGAVGLGFDFQADQIRHNVMNNSPPFRCFFGAVLLKYPGAKSRRLAPPVVHTRFGIILRV